MTNEDKQLLLKDLSARLPYGVKVQYNNKVYAIDYISAEYKEVKLDILNNYTVGISDIKPFLRPMSSMAEEEKKEYYETMDKYTHRLYPNSADFSEHTEYSWTTETFDFLNARHLDYRGLIPMGLAIEAPKDMYNIN